MAKLTIEGVRDYLVSRTSKDPGPTLTNLVRMIDEDIKNNPPGDKDTAEPAPEAKPTRKKSVLRRTSKGD